MDSNPYNKHNSTFVHLLNSQQEVVFGVGEDSNFADTPLERIQRRTWTPTDDAAKGYGKQEKAEGKTVAGFESMWRIRKEDMAMKERLSKMKLLDSLLAKNEPLADYEEALKKKLINELLLSN
ncbi:hypothetical protein Bca52824_075745 [Brassica carinata]|uniref:No apical meristem-associated C-terminal domain-containing protein n=1 Tax=Brassica carinata TaxID=52824 RepID=A0A8X7PQZ2_BRACI|nr:hypothetical protein Bca52824_075745 [Brassica carinata]